MRPRSVLLALGISALAAVACSSDDSRVSTPSEQETSDAPHNDADVVFAQRMIPHHQQAVDMAHLATERAENEDVVDLAARIEAAQAPEIEEMTGWLEDWSEDVPAYDAHPDMDMDSGLMSGEEMLDLEEASGAEFDRMFLEMMVVHHEGAVDMAETELAEGAFPDAIGRAEAIVSSQEDEIEEMNRLLADMR